MIPLSLVLLKGTSIRKQLEWEEAVLRCDQRNWCIINEGTLPSIVLGISGKTEVLINVSKFQEAPVPLIRRFSGGGTVFVDKGTNFITWIFNAEDIDVPCCPRKIGAWTEIFYKTAFPQLNLCLKENDYVINDKKFGGNAQYLVKNRWLHHTSFLWDYRSESMDYLTLPPKTPNYRRSRNHTDFLGKLKEYFDAQSSITQKVTETLQSTFRLTLEEEGSLIEISKQPHRKSVKQLEV